jgi:hypothetical protein
MILLIEIEEFGAAHGYIITNDMFLERAKRNRR